jgi:hypothetical protein
MTTERDLEQRADVYWFPADHIPACGAAYGGERKMFATLREAVLFVMTELPEGDRDTAWIGTDYDHIEIEEIRRIFLTITSSR